MKIKVKTGNYYKDLVGKEFDVIEEFDLLYDNLYFIKGYTTYCIIEAIKLIGVYKTYLIHKNKYVMDFDYCSEMMISHITHMFSFWLFGKYSAIKPEYRDALIAFKIKNDKTIKENAKNAENIRQLHIQEMKENLKNML